MWTAADFGEDDRWTDDAVWSSGQTVAVPVNMPNVAAQPRYLIEWLATVQRSENSVMIQSSYSSLFDRIEVFRITARGVGGSANSEVFLQSTYGMVF